MKIKFIYPFNGQNHGSLLFFSILTGDTTNSPFSVLQDFLTILQSENVTLFSWVIHPTSQLDTCDVNTQHCPVGAWSPLSPVPGLWPGNYRFTKVGDEEWDPASPTPQLAFSAGPISPGLLRGFSIICGPFPCHFLCPLQGPSLFVLWLFDYDVQTSHCSCFLYLKPDVSFRPWRESVLLLPLSLSV